MVKESKLLVAGVIAIFAVAGLPAGYEAWQEQRRLGAHERFIAAKDREIACLDALLKKGVTEEMDVTSEIDRCKRGATEN